MADKKISELTQVSALNNGDLVEVSQVNALAPSGYTSLKASMTDLGKKVNADIEYTTELSDFADKTPLGAIKETAKGKNIADEYDGTQTYDKGDVVIYKNTLYICTTNNTTGTWDATKWTATTIDNVIGSLSSLTTSDKSSLVGAVNEIARYTPVYGNTASGAIATFDTSLALPLQDCTIAINGTNLTGANVSVRGVNLWDEQTKSGYYTSTQGYVNYPGQLCSKDYIAVKPNTTYVFKKPTKLGDITYYGKNKDYLDQTLNITSKEYSFTTPANCYYININLGSIYGAVYNNDVSINYPSTDTDYHAYNPNSTTTAISWNGLGTVSEGSLNVTTGKLTVVNGSMASGVYQITPIPINQLSGTNNIFCDTGNTSVVYACSLKDYIDSQ